MRYRPLGDSGIDVSEVALGSWLTFGAGISNERAVACVDAAFEAGINFIDTANVYGRGAAEDFLGEMLSGRPRDSYVLATKVYFPMSDTDHGLTSAQIHKQVDASLQRLRTDYVDLYQCHRYDVETPLDETMEALSEVVRAGKARHIGFSEWNSEQIQSGLDLVASSGVEKFVSSQPQYSILWREPERRVIPICAANGISQIVWSPLAQGVLSGKYRPGEQAPGDSRMASDKMNVFMHRFRNDRLLERVQGLAPIAERLGITMSQLAIAWVLREPNVASAIIGASRPEQVLENAGASDVELDASTLAEIDALFD